MTPLCCGARCPALGKSWTDILGEKKNICSTTPPPPPHSQKGFPKHPLCFLLPSSPLTPLLLDVEFQEASPAMPGARGRLVGFTIRGAEPKIKIPPHRISSSRNNYGRDPVVFSLTQVPSGCPSPRSRGPPCETTSPSPSTRVSPRGGAAQRMSNCHQIGIFGAD